MKLGVLLLAAVAHAHPGGDGRPIVGFRLALGVSEEVSVRLVAEIPAARVGARMEDPAFVSGALAELQDRLTLSWEGRPLAWERSTATVEPGENNYVELVVEGVATLPAGSGRLEVHNHNLEGEQAVFATTVEVAGNVVVVESSLANVDGGEVRRDRHGAWIADEAGREPWVSIRPARWWERSERAAPLPERMAGIDALAPPLVPLAAAVATVGIVGWVWRGRRVPSGVGVRHVKKG